MNRTDTSAQAGHDSMAQIYFRDLRRHKLLDAGREKELARRFRVKKDDQALQKLIKGNLRLVVKIAKGFWTGNGTSFIDLIQEGNMGLVKAARKYDPGKKAKFSHYASFWIKAYMYRYMMDNYRFVRIGKKQSQRKLFYNLKKTKTQLEQEGIEPSPAEIARRLRVPPKDLIEIQQHLENPEVSLNDPVRGRHNSEKLDLLAETSLSVEEKFETYQLRNLLLDNAREFKKNLDRRETDILEQRILAEKPKTLKILGDTYGVSRERIRQVESRIIERLRAYLLNEFPDIERYFYN
jgi:RNA polymerase sigma-32 factor